MQTGLWICPGDEGHLARSAATRSPLTVTASGLTHSVFTYLAIFILVSTRPVSNLG